MDGPRPEWTAGYLTVGEAETILGHKPNWVADAMCYSLPLFSKDKITKIMAERKQWAEEQEAARVKAEAAACEAAEEKRRAEAQANLRRILAEKEARKMAGLPEPPKPAAPLPAQVRSLVKLVPRAVASRVLGRDPVDAGLSPVYQDKTTGFHPEALRAALRGDA